MNKFLQSTQKALNKTYTENGALSNASTLDACLDLFGSIASMRGQDEKRIQKAFAKAYSENPEKAMKILFWARDVRSGAGEREVFRSCIRYYLAGLSSSKKSFERRGKFYNTFFDLVAHYGRYDDILSVVGSTSGEVEAAALSYYGNKLAEDQRLLVDESASVSLAAKWAPSENASSKKTKALARLLRKNMGLSSRDYRKLLVGLRSRIKIVETQMCANEWEKIDYPHVPSRAGLIYRKAFTRHDKGRYTQYLADVADGKAKINASTLYPYDIVRHVRRGEDSESLNVLWENLPNYVEPFNGIVVCDVSGSMYTGRSSVLPLDVSVSLALYISERNKGAFKDHFITFSETPELVKVVGKDVCEKVQFLNESNWGMSTNLISVFKLVLDAAVENAVPAEEMPEKLFIVSDMQFDQATGGNRKTNLDKIKSLYSKSGYKVPDLIFWNVDTSSDYPITKDDDGTCIVSGFSPSILESVLKSEVVTPIDVMNQTVESPRYDEVSKLFEI